MILIITHKEDYTVDFIVDKLNKRNIEYFRFNCEDIDNYGYAFSFGQKSNFQIGDVSKVKSVWFRRTKLPHIEMSSESEKIFILQDYETLLSNIYPLLKSVKWMSYPSDVYLAENKLFQLTLAAEIGFTVPESLVTSKKEELLRFCRKHEGRVIIKPITHGRITRESGFENIFTNLLNPEHLENLDEFDLTPCIYQKYYDKEYELRVTVVGSEVFTAKVDSQSNEKTMIDWRREKNKFEPYDLPKELHEKCLNLVSAMSLNFGAIDLIKSTNGDYIFLEINPNGQWAWIEFDTNLQISEAIIKYLAV